MPKQDFFERKQTEADGPKQMMQTEYRVLERNMLKARVGGEQAEVKPQSQTADKAEGNKAKTGGGSGSKLAGGKERVQDGVEEQIGANPKDNSFSQKEFSNISGVVNWKKGYSLWDKEATLWRALEFNGEASAEKVGKGTAAGRLDVAHVRGRVFGEADLDWQKLALKLGLGVQGAFEVIGAHIELKHDAPKVTLAGVDAALHTVINGDAFIGVVAEGEAMLNVNIKDLMNGTYLRLGGKAFAGAQASISGSSSLGNLASMDATADAYAGLGGKALVDVGFIDGKFQCRAGAGGALAYGAGFEWGFSVNIAEIGKLADNAGKNVLADPANYPGNLLLEVGSVLGTNVGVVLHFADEVFHLSPGGEQLPSESSSRNTDEGLTVEEKKSGNARQKPLA